MENFLTLLRCRQKFHCCIISNQPFNDNMLRPCPMLENPDKLGEMVKESKAVNTDYQSPETPEHLKEKAAPYAENWTPTAEKLWNKEKEKIAAGKAGVEQ